MKEWFILFLVVLLLIGELQNEATKGWSLVGCYLRGLNDIKSNVCEVHP